MELVVVIICLTVITILNIGFKNNWCKHKFVFASISKTYNDDDNTALPVSIKEITRCSKCGMTQITKVS